VYFYDEIPQHLKVQVVHIVRDAFGKDKYGNDRATGAYRFVHNALCREYGKFNLIGEHYDDSESVFNYFLNSANLEESLDIIELCFKVIDTGVRKEEYQWDTVRKMSPDNAIAELNSRFQEHGVGYQFESSKIIQVDSKFAHTEIVKPVLRMLRDERMYKGANEEFLSAHEHYRHKRNKECLNDCLKSFESVMKAIFDKRKWAYDKNATAKKLIDICFQNNLIPAYMQSQYSSLRSILESGVPAMRNKTSGHGQGSTTTTVTQPLASYALHLTAANILFLAERDEELK